MEQLALSPQCGFASTCEGNKVSPDDQWRKLKLVSDIAREVWQKVGHTSGDSGDGQIDYLNCDCDPGSGLPGARSAEHAEWQVLNREGRVMGFVQRT